MLPILGGRAPGRVSSPHGALSGAELTARAAAAAAELADAGARVGSRVAIGPESDAVSRVCWLLGADLLDAATLLTEPSWSERERAAVLDDARPDVVVDGAPRSTAPASVPASDGRADTHFYLPTTSGSSDRPRVLVRDRRSWWDSFTAFEVGLRAGDALLVPGPLSSSLFLFATMHGLHAGAEVRLLERWSAHEAAEACREATAVHLVPSMLAALVSIWERTPALRDGCALRTVICGGARVDDELRERLRAVLPGCALVEYYGSAEHSVVALRTDGGPLLPVSGAEVWVADGTGEAPRGQPGELWVRSGLLFDGWVTGGYVHHREPGASSVGDRAIHHEDGSLTVLGRSTSALTGADQAGTALSSGARVVSAEEVEAALRGAAGVLDVVIAATPHARFGSLVTAIVEPDPRDPPRLSDLRQRARRSLEPAKRPRRWLSGALPRTPSGKPARARIDEQLRAGTLAAEVLR